MALPLPRDTPFKERVMIPAANIQRESEPALSHVNVLLVGTGASAPTKLRGAGITVARAAAGRYTLTFAESPGWFLGFTPGLYADTPANIAAHTVIVDTPGTAPTATTPGAAVTVVEVDFFDAAGAAHDLAAAEYIYLDLVFGK